MKEIMLDTDFADASYKFCQTINDDLIVYINSWNNKSIKITFFNVIQFTFREGSFLAGVYEKNDKSSFLVEALTSYYEKIPNDHSFKIFVILDIEDRAIFEITAEKACISEE